MKLHGIFFIWVCSLLTATAPPAAAQPMPLRFENFTTQNGLPQNSGYAIAQTAEGYMWFGTQDGLCRYDGYRLKVYRKVEGDSGSLCGNQVNALCTDYKGNLWVATSNGICVYQRKADHFTRPSGYTGSPRELDGLNTQGLLQDRMNNIWVVSLYDGLYLLPPNGNKTKSFFKTLPEKLSLREIKPDEQNNVCISTGKDLFRFNGETFTPLAIHQASGLHKEAVQIEHFLFARGELWLATQQHGLIRIDSNRKKILEQVDTRNKQWQLKKNEITDLLYDGRGNIWVGTVSSGIYKYHYSSKQLSNGRYTETDEYSIRKNYIISLFEDRQGIIWAGTSGGGVAKYDPGSYLFQVLPLVNREGHAPDNMIMSLYNAGNKGFYAGTQSGGLVKADSSFENLSFFKHQPGNTQSILHDNINQMDAGTDGNIWIATGGGLCNYAAAGNKFTSYTGISDLLHKEFYSLVCIAEEDALLVSGSKGLYKFNTRNKQWQHCNDSAGFTLRHLVNGRYMWQEPGKNCIWICSEGLGLLRYDFKRGQFKEFAAINKKYNTIRHLYKNADSIWLATDFGLVLLSEKKETILKVFNAAAGLPGNVIYAILPDKQNNLWLSSNSGLSCLNTTTQTIKNFNEGYGLQGAEFNTAACCTDEKGNLFFGGVNGINYFFPGDIPVNNYTATPLITGITVMNKPYWQKGNVTFMDTLELPYHQNFVSFEYTNPNYSHTAGNSFACKLTGVDKDWVNAGNKNTANYTNLAPGTYTFFVKSANNEGVWHPRAAAITIIIQPPFWATGWFRLVCLAAITGSAWYLYWQRMQSILRKAAVERQLSDFEMKALHAQMNPHFIFNCLNSIKEMILVGENKNASRYLSSFAQIIRDTLDQSKQTFVSLQQSIMHLTRYIEMEKIRIDDFTFTIKTGIELNTSEIKIPPMLLQPLVENVIWHGFHKNKKEKILRITFEKQDNHVCCMIEDNGPGIDLTGSSLTQQRRESLAIINIRERIRLLNEKFNMDCSLSLIDKSSLGKNEKGTVAKLLIPLEMQ
jgi:ligand-binding sensor domain-containing protein